MLAGEEDYVQPSYVCSARKQEGMQEGKQADWVIKQSTSSND